MEHCHIIDTAVFDVSFASEDEAFARQDEFVSVCNNRLLRVINDVFSEISGPENVIRIELLELDLGAIPMHALQDEMEMRLQEKLREKLSSQLSNQPVSSVVVPTANTAYLQIVSKQQAELGTVQYFLLNGCLPWNANLAKPYSFDHLLQRVVDSNAKQLLAFLTQQISNATVINRLANQIPQQTLNTLIDKFNQIQIKDDYHSKIITQLLSRSNNELTQVKNLTNKITSPDTQRLRQRLQDALLAGNVSDIKTIWPSLRDDHAVLLVNALQHYGRNLMVRRNIAKSFLLTMLKDSVKLLEPSNNDFIISIVNDSRFHELLIQHNGATGLASKAKIKRRLYEYSFNYLLVEKSTGFSKNTYLHSLVRQIATQNNTTARAQLKQLIRNLSATQTTTTSDSNRQQNQAVLNLCRDLSGTVTSEVLPQHAKLQSVKIIRAYEVFHKLNESLVNGNDFSYTANKGGMFLDLLAAEYPPQLLRFYRDLQYGAIAVDRLTHVLSLSDLRAVVRGWLIFINNFQENGISDFLAAIASFETKAKDAKYYYQQILQRLVDNESIDFEVILANASATDSVTKIRDPDATKKSNNRLSDNDAHGVENNKHSPKTPTNRAKKAFTEYLKKSGKLSQNEDDANNLALNQSMQLMLKDNPQQLRRSLETTLMENDVAARLIKLLHEHQLSEIMLLLREHEHHNIQQYADCIANACYNQELAIKPDRISQLKWQFIFQYVFEEARPFKEELFIHQFADFIAAQAGVKAKSIRALLIQQLSLNTQSSTKNLHNNIIEVLRDNVHEDEAQQVAITDTAPIENKSTPVTEHVYIYNAGLVLAATYLPTLFERLDLIDKSNFKDRHAAERAVHLAQYLVNESSDTPEYLLLLNKLLCGVKPETPVVRTININDKEIQTIESLLQGMIQHWDTLGNTSINGFRSSFLQREGRLQLKDDAWQLSVEPKAYDMLLDQLPWSFSIIKHPWMEKPIYVDWR